MGNILNIISSSASHTQKVGMRLGELAEAGDIILLVGELGVGKTCLTQGIAKGMEIDEYIVSPTFILLREYPGVVPLYHIDFYRLGGIEEVASLGLDDYLYGDGVCVIEWAEKGVEVLPGEHLLVEMKHLEPTKRELSLLPKGSRYEEMLTQLRKERSSAGR